MSEDRSERIRARIEASQQRLERDSDDRPHPVREQMPPDNVSGLLGDYPGLAVAAGLGVGLLLGAALPKSFASGLTRRTSALLGAASEVALLTFTRTSSAEALPLASPTAIRAAGAQLARRALEFVGKAPD